MESPPKRELTTKVLNNLTKVPSYLSLSKTQFVMYNLVEKASNTGLFRNQRLLILNVRRESICYLSKAPNTLIPFWSQQEVLTQAPKEILYRSEVFEDGINKLQCQLMPDKLGIKLRLTKRDRKLEWIFYFNNQEQISAWFSHISFLFMRTQEEVDAFYHKKEEEANSLPDKKIQMEHNPHYFNRQEHSHNEQRHQNQAESPVYEKNSKAEQGRDEQQEQMSPVPITNRAEKQSNRSQWKEKISQLSDKKQKQSDFHEFDQSMPLGSFVRGNTAEQIQKQQESPQFRPTQKKDLQQEEKGAQQKEKGLSQEYTPGRVSPYSNRSINSRRPLDITQGGPAEIEQKRQVLGEEEGNYRKDANHRLQSGMIRRLNAVVSPKADTLIQQNPGNPWNDIYYSDKRFRAATYFDFVKQCTSRVQQMIDQLPLRYEEYCRHTKNDCLYRKSNGVEYFIQMHQNQEESLIYELEPYEQKQHKVNLRHQFICQRSIFNQHQKEPPLSVFIQYKSIPVLCKAYTPINTQEQVRALRSEPRVEDIILKGLAETSLHITSATDFRELMRRHNIYSLDWTYIYNNCGSNPYFQTIILSQMYSSVFINMLKKEVFDLTQNFPLEELNHPDQQLVEQIIVDAHLHLINRLLADNEEADELWDQLQKETERINRVNCSRQDVNQSYLFYAVILSCGIRWADERDNLKYKISDIIDKTKIIDNSTVLFTPIVDCLHYQLMSSKYIDLHNYIQGHPNSKLKSSEVFQLREEVKSQIPSTINYFIRTVDLALTRQIPFTRHGIASDIYSIMNTGRPSSFNYLTAVQAVRWLIVQSPQEAGDLCFEKIEEILYYAGRIPLISAFYQTIALHQFKLQEYEKGISNFRRSIDNLVTIFGEAHSLILQKKRYLAGIYSQANRKEQCLKELLQCKSICEAGGHTHTRDYPSLLMNISKMTLCSGKINESIASSLECLKCFQNSIGGVEDMRNQQQALSFLQVSELLLRSFELSKRSQESIGIASVCLERCKQLHSIKIMNRLLKIVLMPYLKKCDFRDSHNLLLIVEDLGAIYKDNRISKKSLERWVSQHELMKALQASIPKYFKSLKNYYEAIEKERTMLKYRLSFEMYLNNLQQKSQTINFLNDCFLMVNVVGVPFYQSLLRDSYYE